ncbi:MAG: phosphate-starvation-inducible PsiE family protein [Hydrogenobaculum sp.]
MKSLKTLHKTYRALLEPHKLHDKLGDLFEFFEDAIIVSLTLLLFYLSVLAIIDIGRYMIYDKYSFYKILPKFTYLFILAELFRLMIVYLKERRLDTALIIKTTIIAVLRELLIKAPYMHIDDYIGISILLSVLALMYYLPKYFFVKDMRKGYYKRFKVYKKGKNYIIKSEPIEEG